MVGQPPQSPGDDELVERARRGDIHAYEVLVRQHQEIAFRTAYLIAGDPDEAEDAAQEAFVKAYYALSRFRPGAPFRPWLLRIAANEAHNRRKAAGRRVRLALRAEEARAPWDESPEGEVLEREREAELLQALEELRDEDRLVIASRYFLDLSEEEMAMALGCARGTVKSRLSRALARLREVLGIRRAEAPTSSPPIDHSEVDRD